MFLELCVFFMDNVMESFVSYKVASRGNGATTVSATMFFASRVSMSWWFHCILHLIQQTHFLIVILFNLLTSSIHGNLLQVGIPVFVTGGIGGVHRHGEQSKILCMDK